MVLEFILGLRITALRRRDEHQIPRLPSAASETGPSQGLLVRRLVSPPFPLFLSQRLAYAVSVILCISPSYFLSRNKANDYSGYFTRLADSIPRRSPWYESLYIRAFWSPSIGPIYSRGICVGLRHSSTLYWVGVLGPCRPRPGKLDPTDGSLSLKYKHKQNHGLLPRFASASCYMHHLVSSYLLSLFGISQCRRGKSWCLISLRALPKYCCCGQGVSENQIPSRGDWFPRPCQFLDTL